MRFCLKGVALDKLRGLCLGLVCHPWRWTKLCICRYRSIGYCELRVHMLIPLGYWLQVHNHVSPISTRERILDSHLKWTFWVSPKCFTRPSHLTVFSFTLYMRDLCNCIGSTVAGSPVSILPYSMTQELSVGSNNSTPSFSVTLCLD